MSAVKVSHGAMLVTGISGERVPQHIAVVRVELAKVYSMRFWRLAVIHMEWGPPDGDMRERHNV